MFFTFSFSSLLKLTSEMRNMAETDCEALELLRQSGTLTPATVYRRGFKSLSGSQRSWEVRGRRAGCFPAFSESISCDVARGPATASWRSQTLLSSRGASVFTVVSSSCAEQQNADASVGLQRWWYGAAPCPACWIQGTGTVLLPDTPDTAGWCQPLAVRPSASHFRGLVTSSALRVLNYLRVRN